MNDDPLAAVAARAAEFDDVILAREALRLGLSWRDVQALRLVADQPLIRGAVGVPPIRNPLRASARAAQLVVPSSAISHGTATHLHDVQGIGFWTPDRAVDLTLASRATRRQRQGIRLHFRDLSGEEIVDLGGLRVTSIARTLADCAAESDRASFVSLVDSALNRGRLRPEDLPAFAEHLRRARCSRAIDWLRFVDGRSESPSETRVRLNLTDAGLPPDELQLLVYDDDGYPVARLDMAYQRGRRRVGVEVDSSEHDRLLAMYRDRDKHNALRGLGWDVRRVTQRDSRTRPQYVVVQVRNALGLPD